MKTKYEFEDAIINPKEFMSMSNASITSLYSDDRQIYMIEKNSFKVKKVNTHELNKIKDYKFFEKNILLVLNKELLKKIEEMSDLYERKVELLKEQFLTTSAIIACGKKL